MKQPVFSKRRVFAGFKALADHVFQEQDLKRLRVLKHNAIPEQTLASQHAKVINNKHCKDSFSLFALNTPSLQRGTEELLGFRKQTLPGILSSSFSQL